jgi:hypothetical protein
LIAGVLFSLAFSGELKAVSVVNEAVEDGVAQGGVADNFVPMFDGDLAGDDGRGATVAFIQDLQKVAPLGRIENRKAPVIEDQELNAADGFEQAAIAAVAASKGKRLEQTRDAVILDRAIVAAGFVPSRLLTSRRQTSGICDRPTASLLEAERSIAGPKQSTFLPDA